MGHNFFLRTVFAAQWEMKKPLCLQGRNEGFGLLKILGHNTEIMSQKLEAGECNAPECDGGRAVRE